MYFVTGNRHKFEEIKNVLKRDIKMLSLPYPEIQADMLEEVAVYGIKYLKDKVDEDFFVEDSGLFIESLNGFPGVFSSYVFKTLGNEGILKLMEGKENRKAIFVSVIAYYDGKIHIFRGECRGNISMEIRGNRGFGYDPIFIPENEMKTFGEMEMEKKNKFSHRGQSAKKFREYLDKIKIN